MDGFITDDVNKVDTLNDFPREVWEYVKTETEYI